MLNPSSLIDMTDPKTPQKLKPETKESIWHSARKGGHNHLQLNGTYCGKYFVLNLIVKNVWLEIAFGKEDCQL